MGHFAPSSRWGRILGIAGSVIDDLLIAPRAEFRLPVPRGPVNPHPWYRKIVTPIPLTRNLLGVEGARSGHEQIADIHSEAWQHGRPGLVPNSPADQLGVPFSLLQDIDHG